MLAGIGQLAGLILLWGSRTWTLRQKVLGTLIPLALVGMFVCRVAASSASNCSSNAPCAAPPTTAGDVVALVIAALLAVGIVAAAVSLLRSGSGKRQTVLPSH
jgi:hypothetical protein